MSEFEKMPVGYMPDSIETCQCGRGVTRGCACLDCNEWEAWDEPPPEVMFHCLGEHGCGRWWYYLNVNRTRLDIDPNPQ